MLLLVPALLALAPAQKMPCQPPRFLDTTEHPKPVERAGPGLWIGGIRFEAADIQSAVPEQNKYTDQWELHLTFTMSGAAKFHVAEHCGVNRPIEISFDRKAISRPMLNEVIEGAEVSISGNFTHESAAALAARIKPAG